MHRLTIIRYVNGYHTTEIIDTEDDTEEAAAKRLVNKIFFPHEGEEGKIVEFRWAPVRDD